MDGLKCCPGVFHSKLDVFRGEAEKELLRATALHANDVPSLLALADTYIAINCPQNAESTLRNVIALAGARTDQDIARAHYLLGRLHLAQPTHQDEAKHEFALVADMQKASGTVLTADARAAGSGSVLRQNLVRGGTEANRVLFFFAVHASGHTNGLCRWRDVGGLGKYAQRKSGESEL
jgi:hypothetical protein